MIKTKLTHQNQQVFLLIFDKLTQQIDSHFSIASLTYQFRHDLSDKTIFGFFLRMAEVPFQVRRQKKGNNQQTLRKVSDSQDLGLFEPRGYSPFSSAEKTCALKFRTALIIIKLMENKNFRKLITLLQQHPNFSSQLNTLQQQYHCRLYKIGDLSISSASELFQNMQKKFYLNKRTAGEQCWYQNQLRLFVWALFGYLSVYQKNLTELDDSDWMFFSHIFNFKSIVFFQFQALSILRAEGRSPPWTEEETNLLQSIIGEKKHKNHWNSIARQLFLRSHKQFFRNPKQCRQRWMNHLDPSKIRSQWTPPEDLILLNTVKKRGKKWSLVVKQLKNTRTEHMVKNRYKSLISNQAKKYPEKRESQIQNLLLKKLSKASIRTNKPQPPIQQIPQISHLSQPQIKQEQPVSQEQHQYELAAFDLDYQLRMNSPIFIPWKPEASNLRANFLDEEDRLGDLNIQQYQLENDEENEQFLRF